MALPFFVGMRENRRVEASVFMMFADLRADVLHNGFGVFFLEFHDQSLLTDANADRLLHLNDIPPKYEITLILNTKYITDASIETLAKLTSADWLVVDRSGLTADGVKQLESLRSARFPEQMLHPHHR